MIKTHEEECYLVQQNENALNISTNATTIIRSSSIELIDAHHSIIIPISEYGMNETRLRSVDVHINEGESKEYKLALKSKPLIQVNLNAVTKYHKKIEMSE